MTGQPLALAVSLAALFGLSACAADAMAQKNAGAERVACAARSDLRVDLNAVASKYIGETEKNLRAALSSGEASAAALTFDEADALFGKRTEVKDAHDRYANIETSYRSQEGGKRLDGFSRRAVLVGFTRRAPKEGVVVIEREGGIDVLTFRESSPARAVALARDYDRACR